MNFPVIFARCELPWIKRQWYITLQNREGEKLELYAPIKEIFLVYIIMKLGYGWRLKKKLGCFWNNVFFFFFVREYREEQYETRPRVKSFKSYFLAIKSWWYGRNNGDVWFEIDARIVFTHLFKNYDLNVRKYINISKLNYSFQSRSVCNILYSIRFRKSITVSCQSGDRFIFDIGSSSIFHKRFYNPAMKWPALIHR